MTVAVLAIDPSMRRTGASVWSYETDPETGRAMPGTALCVLVTSDTRRERDRYKTLRYELARAIGEGVRWWAVLERPPSPKFGVRAAPVAALRDWREWLHDLARERAKDAGVRYAKPCIAEPQPQVWRAPLGLATAGPRHLDHLERRAHLKAQAVRYARDVLKLGDLDDDAAEAACLGAWALRCLLLGSTKVGRGKFRTIHYVA